MASYNSTLLKIQKMANSSATQIQKLVNKSNKLQMEFNSAESQKARDWQEKMTKTSHQMEVKDLKKAGLNPVLSANSGGAQSYTTSSASTQNDSGASASAALLEGQISALSNLESARLNTQAQIQAANAQAAATRYAADRNSAASIFSAQKAYESSVYRSDVDERNNIRTNKANKWISTNKQAGSIPGLIDKYTSKIFGNTALKNGVKAFGTHCVDNFSHMKKNPNRFFTNKGKITADNFKLSKAGEQFVGEVISQGTSHGLKNTSGARRLVVKAFIFGDQKAINTVCSLWIDNNYHHGAKGTPRRGHQ